MAWGQNGRCLNMDQIQGVSQRENHRYCSITRVIVISCHQTQGTFRSPSSVFKQTSLNQSFVSDCLSFCNGLGHNARLAELPACGPAVIETLMRPAISSNQARLVSHQGLSGNQVMLDGVLK